MRSNLTYTIVSQGLVFISSFLYSIVIARGLSVDDLGWVTSISLIPFLMSRFFHFGFDSANAYFVTKNDIDHRALFNNSLILTLILFVVSSVVSVAVYIKLANSGMREPLGAIVLPFLSAVSVFRTLFHSALVGQDRLKLYGVIAIIDSVFPLAVAFLYSVFFELNITIVLLINTVSIFMTSVILFASLELDFQFKPDPDVAKKQFLYGWKSWVNNSANQLLYRIDVFILGYFWGPKHVALYAIATLLSEKTWYLSGAIGSAIFPKVARCELKEGAKLASRAASLNFTLVLLAVVFLYFVSEYLIFLLFGDRYEGALTPLYLILPGMVFLSVPKVLVSHLAAKDMLHLAVMSSSAALIVNVTLNLILIPKYYENGAAAASSISYFVYMIIYVWFYIKCMDVPLSSLFIFKASYFSSLSK